jgi:hypothetical protein
MQKAKPSKKHHAKDGLQGPLLGPADAAQAAANQIEHKQALQLGSHAAGSSSAHMAADLSKDAHAEGGKLHSDLGADKEDGIADGPPGAGGTAVTRPRLTEEQRAERQQRTVFIGNLPAAVKTKRIKQAFSRCAHAPIFPLHASASLA